MGEKAKTEQGETSLPRKKYLVIGSMSPFHTKGGGVNPIPTGNSRFSSKPAPEQPGFYPKMYKKR